MTNRDVFDPSSETSCPHRTTALSPPQMGMKYQPGNWCYTILKIHDRKGFYGSWCVSYVLIVSLVLKEDDGQEELQVPYTLKIYKRTPEKLAPPELKAVHPLGKSPLITDGELTLAESGAIVGE